MSILSILKTGQSVLAVKKARPERPTWRGSEKILFAFVLQELGFVLPELALVLSDVLTYFALVLSDFARRSTGSG